MAQSGRKILIVDDEQDHAEVMCEALERQGYTCDTAHSLGQAKANLDRKRYDVIVSDLIMEGKRDGLDLLKQSRKLSPPPPLILVTAVNDVPTSKEAIREGAFDYIVKPLDLDEFRAQVSRASQKAQSTKMNEVVDTQLIDRNGFEAIIGNSQPMQNLIRTSRQLAQSDIPVLILGESGTGKELLARAIHDSSKRRKGRLVAMNCAGMPEGTLEDELFGHVKGAFTGAVTERQGRFEHADHGTLFLDEIGDMPLLMQAKLLRVLENGEVVRLGSNDSKQVSVRFVSATNRDLEQMVAEKQFREDLYFRIKGVTLTIPPLRERREDIPLLTWFFMRQSAEKYGKEIDDITADAQKALMSYPWPGNVRQLKLVVENLVVLTPGNVIGTEHLPTDMRSTSASPIATSGSVDSMAGLSMEQVEREHIRSTLERVQGNREQAAKLLNIGERTLYRKIKEYDL